jgi:hypothetical protein
MCKETTGKKLLCALKEDVGEAFVSLVVKN